MKISDKILVDIISGEYRPGQRLFVDSLEFTELLASKILIERDKVFRPETNALTINGVTIMRAPKKILADIEKSREKKV